MRTLLMVGFYLSAPFLILGCNFNFYEFAQGGLSNSDRLELAQECLHRSDFKCAEWHYGKLSNETLKKKKLCSLYLTQSGFGFKSLASVFTQQDSKKSLGAAARSILPYTEDKKISSDKAIEYCTSYKEALPVDSKELETGKLLQVLAHFTRCSVLIARTTKVRATSESDTACSVSVNESDIFPQSIAENVSNGTGPGMCPVDAVTCFQDLNKLAEYQGGQSSMGNAFDQLGNLLNSNVVSAIRKELISTL